MRPAMAILAAAILSGCGPGGGSAPPANSTTSTAPSERAPASASSRAPRAPRAAPAARAAAAERVLAVDDDAHLVMISVGSDDGAGMGERCTVIRGEKFIATVEIEKTFSDMSSARIITMEVAPGERVREGDAVVR